jgi:hypothetical protein
MCFTGGDLAYLTHDRHAYVQEAIITMAELAPSGYYELRGSIFRVANCDHVQLYSLNKPHLIQLVHAINRALM